MRGHMLKHRISLDGTPNENRGDSSQPPIAQAFGAIQGPRFRNKKDRRTFRLKRTCDWVVDTLQPFSAVEEASYRNMILSYDIGAQPFSEKSVRECLIAKESEVRKAVIGAANSATVALTVDHWTSRAKHNYTGMTLHFIDKHWNLVCLPLGCFLHEGDSKSKTLHDDFLVKLFNECGFGDLNIACVVSDTTANMNKFGQLLEALGTCPAFVLCLFNMLLICLQSILTT